MYLVDRLLQIFCRTVCKERDNNLPAQVITFQESTDHHGRIMPPDGRTDQNDIIIFYIVGQIGYSRTKVIIRFVLDTATVIIRIAGIRLGRLDTVYICTCRRYNLVGKAFCISWFMLLSSLSLLRRSSLRRTAEVMDTYKMRSRT